MRHLVGFSWLIGLSSGLLFGCSLSTVGAMDPVEGGKCDTPMQTATAKDDCTQCTCSDSGTWACDASACMASGGSSGTSGNSMGGKGMGTGGTGMSTGGTGMGTGGTGMAGSAGMTGKCMPGDTMPSADGCNTCSCGMDGAWACTEKACAMQCTPGEVMNQGCNDCTCDDTGAWSCVVLIDAGCPSQTCTPGEMLPAGDGCNTCTCGMDGQLACTTLGCEKDCPPPADYDPATCMSMGPAYAQNPMTAQCCTYATSCAAPAGWKTYTTPDCSATDACAPGKADCDGDPSNGCETDVTSDPNNCGSCGNVCMSSDGVMETCAMSACIGPEQQVGTGCFYGGVDHAAGDSFASRDGCNACSCLITGDGTTDIACTDKACVCMPDREPYRKYAGTSPDACKAVDFSCPEDTTPFTNDCGCGCEESDECPNSFDCSSEAKDTMTSNCDQALMARCPYSAVVVDVGN